QVQPFNVGRYSVGGIVGVNRGVIEDSASIGGYVFGIASVGGIAGKNMDNGVINRTLAANYIVGDMASGKVGGIAGSNTGLISNSFWDTDYSGLNSATGSVSGNLDHVLGGCFTGQCIYGGTVNLSSINT